MNTLMKLMNPRLMDEANGNSGEGGGAGGNGNPPTETPTGDGNKDGAKPTTLLDGDGAADGGAAEGKDGGAKDGGSADGDGNKKPSKSGSLLDDDDGGKNDGKDGGKNGEEQPAPTEEQIGEFCKAIPALDLGDGVKWDDATLKAIAPSLMAMTGGDATKAQPLVKAYADHIQQVVKAQAEAADAFNNGLIAECNKRFGADLKKVANYAKKGGAAIFGDKIWNEMKVIPSFANNPDIMEKLAEFGRKISDDTGKTAEKDGGNTQDREDIIHRMYGNVKV